MSFTAHDFAARMVEDEDGRRLNSTTREMQLVS
jgi:hypothetical protein